MRIAILSWGSLLGDSRGLEMAGTWLPGGPLLPIEFSRISQGERAGCLTLVIDETNGVDVRVHYAESSNTNLNAAIKNLRLVEGGKQKVNVGYVNLKEDTERQFALQHQPISCGRIKVWAEAHEFEGVIWTALLANFETITLVPFTVDNAVAYLDGLPAPIKTDALNYIRNSPVEADTPLRKRLYNVIGAGDGPR
jgi:hypothetical protein